MTKLVQAVIDGMALGSIYALIALGFVVVYRATEVINFAHGAIMLTGAYLVHQAAVVWGWPFAAAVVFGVLGCAAVGLLIEATVLRRMIGRPVFAIVMITLGIEIVVRTTTGIVWGTGPRSVGDPWGNSIQRVGDIVIADAKLAAFTVAVVLLVGFFAFFRLSRYGLAMRATALDPEAAMAMGIPTQRILGLSWAIGAGLAAVAGAFLATAAGGSGTFDQATGFVAFRAFPAAILGGLDSTSGAVVGGLLIGLVERLTAGYLPDALGQGFYVVAPYAVMIAVLLVRPQGLFGTRSVERI